MWLKVHGIREVSCSLASHQCAGFDVALQFLRCYQWMMMVMGTLAFSVISDNCMRKNNYFQTKRFHFSLFILFLLKFEGFIMH